MKDCKTCKDWNTKVCLDNDYERCIDMDEIISKIKADRKRIEALI